MINNYNYTLKKRICNLVKINELKKFEAQNVTTGNILLKINFQHIRTNI